MCKRNIEEEYLDESRELTFKDPRGTSINRSQEDDFSLNKLINTDKNKPRPS
jgi:hypothetical protein